MLEISRRLVDDVRERFEALDIGLSVTENTLRWLSEKGYSESYGARSLRRTVQMHLVDKAAELLLEGKIKAGDKLSAEISGEQLCFEKIQ